jgi:hypothetical protein
MVPLDQFRIVPELTQRFFFDRAPFEADPHQEAVDPSSSATSEYRVSGSGQQEKKFFHAGGRARQLYSRSSIRHVDQKAFAAPRAVYRHGSDIERPLKFNAGYTYSTFIE